MTWHHTCAAILCVDGWGNRLAARRGRGAQEEEDGGWGEAGEVVLLVWPVVDLGAGGRGWTTTDTLTLGASVSVISTGQPFVSS